MTDILQMVEGETPSRSRTILLRRLIDYVALPGSRVAPQDRMMGGDILLEMLFHASEDEQELCAKRLQFTREAPRRVLRYLAQCSFRVARPLLEENESFDASDLCLIVEQVSADHRIAIAKRKNVQTMVADRLIEIGEPDVVRALLTNKHAVLSEVAMDALVARSRDDEDLCSQIIKRLELRPSQAMAMFWWSDRNTRREILQRYAANRLEMIEMCADVFAMAAEEGWKDPVSRKTLQLIERRQRNRAAIERSPYEGLEQTIEEAARIGMTPELSTEIGFLCGVKPITIKKVLEDKGDGECLAVLCKATGLKRPYLTLLWRALGHPVEIPSGGNHPDFDYVHEIYDLLTVARAQTTLRYWNWSLSSAFSPAMIQTVMEEEEANDEASYSAVQRTARLVFGS